MKTTRKCLAVLLAVIMTLSVMPFAVFAEEWKDAAAQRAQEVPAEAASETADETAAYPGDLLSAEIIVGNEKSVYAPDGDGVIRLVSQETIRTGGPLRAPVSPAEDAGFDGENVDPLAAYAAADWALNHTFFEATTMRDRNGVATIVYGIDGVDRYLIDDNCDLICDICGYCADGCVDGKVAYYTKDDIVGEAVNGEYFNGDGVLVARDAEETDTYTLVDENDVPILDENGNEQTVTETHTFIQYESFFKDQDGLCDVCGNAICKYDEEGTTGGHDFSDGLCDGCGACVGTHTDAEVIDIADGVCDVCSLSVTHTHTDADGDGTCDECGQPATHTHTDTTGATQTGNGICDLCGWCAGACTDADANGVCDVCGKTILTYCEHSDIQCNASQSDDGDYPVCNICNERICHRTTRNMLMLQGQMGLLAGILAKGDENGDASYHDWLTNTLTPALNAKTKDNDAPANSFASLIAMRQEFKDAIDKKNEVLGLYNRVIALTVDDVTPYSLAGEMRGDTVIDDGCLYGEVNQAHEDYLAAIDNAVFDDTPAYFDYEEGVLSSFYRLYNHLNDLAGALFDAELAAFYGSATPTSFTIDETNLNDVRKKLNNFDEALLYQLYGNSYRDNDLKQLAESVWKNQASLDGATDFTRRAVGFAMLDCIRTRINEIRELAFSRFSQTKYDDENGVYVTRPAYEGDLVTDPAEPYQVKDETINALISRIDGFVASPELLTLLQKLLPDTFEMDIQDANGDGDLTLYDFLMSFLTQKVITNDLINELFGMLYPMITDLGDMVENMMQGAPVSDYLSYEGGHEFTFDLFEMLTGSDAASQVIDAFVGARAAIYINGGKAPTFKKMFRDNGYSFWPTDVAKLLGQVNVSGKYTDIITALNGCSDNWENVMENGKLTFDWGVTDLNDLKNILSVILGTIAPLTEMLFAKEVKVNKQLKLSKLVYLSASAHLLLIDFPVKGNVSLKLNAVPMHLYDDVLVPIFEALGIPSSQCGAIYYENGKTATENAQKVVNGIFNPLMFFVEQLVSQPIETLFSLLPNLSLMMENGKLLELFDFDYSFDLQVLADFPISSWYFDDIWDIIEDNIMKHWYDWLKPWKYAQLVNTVAFYWAVNLAMDGIFGGDMMGLAKKFGIIDSLDDMAPAIKGLPVLPDLLNALASMLGGHLGPNGGDYTVPDSVKLQPKLGEIIDKKKINLYDMLESAYLTNGAVRNIGFDLNQLSSVINWFFGHLKNADGYGIRLFDPEYLDLGELGTLGELEKKSGSARTAAYAKRWNTLSTGQYYYVNADTADVFYYFLRLISEGVLQDETALNTILGMLGMNKDILSVLLATLGEKGADVIGVTLSDLITNACDDSGKLSLDKLLSNMTADNLLLVLCEFMEPADGKLDAITYPETDDVTAAEITAHDGVIPYLEYDNLWTDGLAEFIAKNLDDVANLLLEEIPLDLEKSTPDKIETVQEFLDLLIKKFLNEPKYLTMIVELLTCIYTDGLEMPADLIHDATKIDITGWYKDYAYLFNGGEAPETRVFPNLTGAPGDTEGEIVWTYNGETVEDYSDIFAALGYLLTPLDPILNMVFCGDDFNVMEYTKQGQPSGSVLTIKGNDGYNFTLLPLLEAMGIDAMSSDEFKAMGPGEGLLRCVDQIVARLHGIMTSDTMLADLFELLAQVGYAMADNGLGVMLKNSLHPVFVLLDTLRPILNIDINALLNTIVCRYTYTIGGYADENAMKATLQEKGAAIDLRTLNMDALLDLIGVIVSGEGQNGERKYLDLKAPFDTGVNDLAYLREGFNSKAYALDDDGERISRTGYRLNMAGEDAMTSFITLGLEMLMYGDNPDAIDALLGRLLGQHGIVKTALEVLKGIPADYTTDFDWAYILGDAASADEKAALLEQIKTGGPLPAEGNRTARAQKDYDKYLASFDMTDWDEETAVYLVEHLDAMLANALNADLGGETLGAKVLGLLGVESTQDSYTVGSFAETLVNGILCDDMLDQVLGFIGAFLNGKDHPWVEKLAEMINPDQPEKALELLRWLSARSAKYNDSVCRVADGIGIRLELFNIDESKNEYKDGKVIYYNFDGEPTGLKRTRLDGDYTRMGDLLYDLTVPVQPLLAFLLLGKDLALFNSAGVPDVRERRDDVIHVTGIESYRYALLPLLEALGCEGLQPAETYGPLGGADGQYKPLGENPPEEYNIDALMNDLCHSLIGLIEKLLQGDTLDNLICMLPDLLYFVNSDAIPVLLQNLTAPLAAIVDYYSDYAGLTGEDKVTLWSLIGELTGLELDPETVKLSDVFQLLSAKTTVTDENGTETAQRFRLTANTFIARLLDNFTTGEIYYNDQSACDFDTFRMRYQNNVQKAETVTILMSLAVDLLEDPGNKNFWDGLLGKDVNQTIINELNLNDFKFDYQDPDWKFTEYADTDHLVSALTLSKLFDLDPYAGKLWTREMAAELADNLEQFVNDMLYLLGLEINGIKITNLRELMHALIGGMLFTNDMMNKLTGLLGQIKPLLDKYDPDGAIAGFIRELVGIDLHAWDVYAKGGIYENGRDWGFSTESTEAAVDANGAIFEAALIELLSPAAQAMAWMLAERDYTFLAEGDGLGVHPTDPEEDHIQITLPGSEGYRYALVPLFEALNIDGRPQNMIQNLRDGDICTPAEYTENVKKDVSFAVTGVVHPLVAMVQKLMDSTATQLLELLPSIVYFINSNGIDTVIKNLIHSLLIIANAAEPLKNQIDALVYDENGFDLYRTVKLEKLIRESLYTLVGVSEEDVKDVYAQCGGVWDNVDGLEDVDFRYLFSVAIAALNNLLARNGVGLKFTSIASLAVNELTHGYVRSYDSLTGKTAYTMILDKEIDRYCFGDLISILMRITLKFLSVDNNADALVALIKTKASINGVGEAAISSFLHLLAGYMGTLGGFEVAMLSIYYTVYGASKGSGAGVDAYDNVNDKLSGVVAHLESLDNDIARAVLKVLISEADEQVGDIIGSQGLAGNGLIRFFKQIYDWLMHITNVLRNLFKQ